VHRWTRRDVLRASAGAAAAVPVAALGAHAVAAAPQTEVEDLAILDRAGNQPVMFCIHDARRGEVSILRGRKEVVVTDRRLVGRLLRAADERRPVSTGRRWFW
jgi:anti-sigma-K factor RskA